MEKDNLKERVEMLEKKIEKVDLQYQFYHNLDISLNALLLLSVADFVFIHPEEIYYSSINFISMHQFYRLQEEKNEIIFDDKKEERCYKKINLLFSGYFLVLSGFACSLARQNNYRLFPVAAPCIVYLVKPFVQNKLVEQSLKIFELEDELNELEEEFYKIKKHR